MILRVRSLHCRKVVFAFHPIGLYIFFNQSQFLLILFLKSSTHPLCSCTTPRTCDIVIAPYIKTNALRFYSQSKFLYSFLVACAAEGPTHLYSSMTSRTSDLPTWPAPPIYRLGHTSKLTSQHVSPRAQPSKAAYFNIKRCPCMRPRTYFCEITRSPCNTTTADLSQATPGHPSLISGPRPGLRAYRPPADRR